MLQVWLYLWTVLTGYLLIEKWHVSYLLRKTVLFNRRHGTMHGWSRATRNWSWQKYTREAMVPTEPLIFNLVCFPRRSSLSHPLHYHCLIVRLVKGSHHLFSKECHVLKAKYILKTRKTSYMYNYLNFTAHLQEYISVYHINK